VSVDPIPDDSAVDVSVDQNLQADAGNEPAPAKAGAGAAAKDATLGKKKATTEVAAKAAKLANATEKSKDTTVLKKEAAAKPEPAKAAPKPVANKQAAGANATKEGGASSSKGGKSAKPAAPAEAKKKAPQNLVAKLHDFPVEFQVKEMKDTAAANKAAKPTQPGATAKAAGVLSQNPAEKDQKSHHKQMADYLKSEHENLLQQKTQAMKEAADKEVKDLKAKNLQLEQKAKRFEA